MLRIFLVILLTILHAGVGQIYNGQRWKGITFIFLVFIGTYVKNFLTIVPLLLLYIVALVDAIIVAIKQNKGHLDVIKGKNILIEILVALVVSMPITYFLNDFVAKNTTMFLNDEGDKISKKEEVQVKRQAKEYLQKKYQQDFTLANVRYTRQTSQYTMEAKPKEEPIINFRVYKKQGEEFDDTLLPAMWRQQSHKEIEPIIKQSFSEHMSFSTSVAFDASVLDQIQIEELPSFQKMRTKTDDYNLKIRLYVIRDITRQNQDEEVQKVLDIINYLNERNINTSLQVEYYDEVLIPKGVDQISDENATEYTDYLRYMFDSTDIESIQTLEEATNCFRTIE